jgi:hypothetical protein
MTDDVVCEATHNAIYLDILREAMLPSLPLTPRNRYIP